MLAAIAELYDYKQVHEALHSARTRGFNLIQLRKDEFPNGTTVREFTMHARDLRKTLQDVQRIRAQKRCDDDMLQVIEEEFSGALETLDEALKVRVQEKLEDALAGLDTLLTAHPARVDACMALLAKRLDLDALLGPLRGGGLAGAAVDDQMAAMIQSAAEMLHLGEKLRSSAALHNLCQNVDTKLAMIRKTAVAQRFNEIRRHWKPMSASLSKILDDWEPVSREAFRLHSEQLGNGVAANDERTAGSVFDEFCDDFDYGFFTVDTDFKTLCGEMNTRAIQSVSNLPAENRPH